MAIECKCGNKYVELPCGEEAYREHLEKCPRTGVCCSCQTIQPLCRVKALGEPSELLVQEHFFLKTNERCGGSLTVPQVVFNEAGKNIQL